MVSAKLMVMGDEQFDTTLKTWLEKLQTTDSGVLDGVREEIIRQASHRLENLARKMLKDFPRLRRWEQTGDVLQNSLLRLHHALSTIRPESPRQFFGLAAVQIRRELIDLSRHHFGPQGAAAKHHTDGFSADQNVSTLERQPDERGEPSNLSEWTEFHEAVQRLPDDERQLFDLHWYQGLEQRAIAELLNVTDRTVKNRWRRAKLLLRDLLDEEREGSHVP